VRRQFIGTQPLLISAFPVAILTIPSPCASRRSPNLPSLTHTSRCLPPTPPVARCPPLPSLARTFCHPPTPPITHPHLPSLARTSCHLPAPPVTRLRLIPWFACPSHRYTLPVACPPFSLLHPSLSILSLTCAFHRSLCRPFPSLSSHSQV
jgi:hypothetical protein